MSQDQNTRSEYFDNLRAVCKEINDAITSGEITDEDDLHTRIHEEADGSYWVIYYHSALATLNHSDNWLAIDDQGLDTPSDDFGAAITLAAFCALEQDIRDHLGDWEQLLEDTLADDDQEEDEES